MESLPDPDSFEELDEKSILWIKLQPFIVRLPAKSRLMLQMIHDGKTVPEIAAKLGYRNEETVYTKRSQTIGKLKKLVEKSKGNEWLKSKLKKKNNEKSGDRS